MSVTLEHLANSPALMDLLEERIRVIQIEGFTPAHDSQWTHGEMAQAAAAYARLAGQQTATADAAEAALVDVSVPSGWPWAREWWKPSTDPARNLVKAGQLILAELDRLHRAAVDG